MSRIENKSNLWLFCCCGCLPIIGFIKGLIIAIPVTILSIFGFTGIALILLPHDIVLTYRAFIKTSIIGINLKILSMLLLPFALAGWPILVLFSSCCFGFSYSFYGATVKTFDSGYDLFFGGINEVFYEVLQYIASFWHFNSHSYFCYLFEMEQKEVDEPFDITIIQIIVGLFLACYGSIVGIIVLTPLWLIKLIPLIIKMYIILIGAFLELSFFEYVMFTIFYIIGFCLIPALGVSSILFCIGYALFGGIECAIEGYKYNYIRGLFTIWEYIYIIDKETNSFIFNKEFTCFPDCSEIYKIKKTKKSTKNKEEVSKKEENSEILEENNLNNSIEAENKQDNSIKNEDEPDVPQELLV